MRKVKKISLVIMTGLLIVGTITNMTSYATVPGTNILTTYSASSSTTTVGSYMAHLSEDGNIIVWSTPSHNVIPSDPYSTSTTTVLYKRDLSSGSTSYVTVDMSGVPIDVDYIQFAVSRTARYIAFATSSTNMVSTPTVPSSPNQKHVYLRDTLSGTTTLVDKTSTGTLANIGGNTASPYPTSVSDDGRFVTFSSQATNLLSSSNPSSPNYNRYYYIKDMQTGQVVNPLVSSAGARANALTDDVKASCDGFVAVFGSNATNLTPQDNGRFNEYLVDFRNGYSITNLTYGANQGIAGTVSISCNGRYIVFFSNSTNLTADSVSGSKYHMFRYDRLTGLYVLIDKSTSGYISSTQYPETNVWSNTTNVSDDGLVVFSSNDHSMVSPSALRNFEVYLRNPEAGTTELVPINTSSVEQNLALPSNLITLEINARGNSVIYESRATNLVPGVTSGANMLVLSKVQ